MCGTVSGTYFHDGTAVLQPYNDWTFQGVQVETDVDRGKQLRALGVSQLQLVA